MSAASVDPSALEERARSAYANGDLEAAIGAWEQLHTLLLAGGDTVGAAEAATMVATHLLIDTGLMAPVRGWVRRAERLLEPAGEVPLHGMLAAIRGYERFFCGDMDAAEEHAARAVALGSRHEFAEAAVIGQTACARITLLRGDLDEGLAQLEDVGARLMAGEVNDLVTGMMLCEVICAVQGLAMHDLAREWTDVMETWRQTSGFGGLHGRCRVHRAELLRISGPMEEAETEALGACADLRPWMRREYGWPLVELGTIRLRRGDLAGAEDAFGQASAHAWCPQPGLALLQLAQGRTVTAAATIAEAIAHPLEIPWKERPPFGDVRLAPLLHAQGEIALAADDAATCAGAAARLEAIAERYPSRSLAAMAVITRARAHLISGDIEQARSLAQDSVGAWADLGAPYESASARCVLARAYAGAGDAALALAAWEVARDVFAAFGAAARVAEIDALLSDEPTAPIAAVREVSGTFVSKGGLRTVRFAGQEVVVPDLKGFRYLERLLSEPGREFHVLDLVSSDLADGTSRQHIQEGLPVLDDEARAAYRRRLAEVEEDLDEARACDDLGRIALAEQDREYLLAELSGAVGLGGRVRMTGGSAERARTSVTRSLRYSLRRLGAAHPMAAGHLAHSLRTGTYCSYAPDPSGRVLWNTGTTAGATELDRTSG